MERILIVSEGFRLFFEDDNLDDEDEIVTNENYVEKIVPRFSDKTFKSRFRMNRDVFEYVCQQIHSIRDINYGRGRCEIPFEKQLMVTLWYLGNPESLRSIADRFGICIATLWRTVFNICESLLKLNAVKKYIKWPDAKEAKQVSRHYLKKYKFPGIVGCIDGTHIRIRTPIHSPNSYINCKNYHSILLQAVCNHKMEFTHCYTGEVGSIHDYNLLRRSGLIYKIESGTLNVASDEHLLGDSAYSLKEWLITPYKDNLHLGDEQKIFNEVHSQCRVVIERAFGMLKGRFRRLFYINSLRPAAIVLYIMGSCILHNICLQRNDFTEILLTDEEIALEVDNEIPISQSAKMKREKLMNSLF